MKSYVLIILILRNCFKDYIMYFNEFVGKYFILKNVFVFFCFFVIWILFFFELMKIFVKCY